MGSTVYQNPPLRAQFHNNAAPQGNGLHRLPAAHTAWAPNNAFEMQAYASPQRPVQQSRPMARPAPQQLPGPVTARRPAPAVQRVRGGGAGGVCCVIISITVGVLVLGALAVGLGVGLSHHHNSDSSSGGGSGDGSGGGAPTPTGGGSAPAPTGGVTGGPSGTALADASLQAITLHGCSPEDYSGAFSVGGQTFQLTIDSGSSTTAIAGSDCGNCNVSPAYKPGRGATATGGNARGRYGDSSGWSGTVYRDTVVGGTSSQNATSPVQMNIVSIDTQTSFFHPSQCVGRGGPQTSDSQGILGLGPASIELPGTDDFASELALVSGLPNAYAFMACDSSAQGSGFMTFGGYHPDLVTQDPEFVAMAVTSQTFPYYGVNIDSVGVGKSQVASNIGATVVDTGTSQLLLQDSAYTSVANALANDQAFSKNFGSLLSNEGSCVQAPGSRSAVDASLPQLTIGIDTGDNKVTTLSLPASKSYLMPMAKDPSSTSADFYCLGIASSGSSGPNIMGNTVMRAFMTIIDVGNQQVGFAPSKGCPQELA